MKVFTLPHHSFASDEYLLGAGLLKNSVMDGAAGTPAAEVARLLQQVYLALGVAQKRVQQLCFDIALPRKRYSCDVF